MTEIFEKQHKISFSGYLISCNPTALEFLHPGILIPVFTGSYSESKTEVVKMHINALRTKLRL